MMMMVSVLTLCLKNAYKYFLINSAANDESESEEEEEESHDDEVEEEPEDEMNNTTYSPTEMREAVNNDNL